MAHDPTALSLGAATPSPGPRQPGAARAPLWASTSPSIAQKCEPFVSANLCPSLGPSPEVAEYGPAVVPPTVSPPWAHPAAHGAPQAATLLSPTQLSLPWERAHQTKGMPPSPALQACTSVSPLQAISTAPVSTAGGGGEAQLAMTSPQGAGPGVPAGPAGTQGWPPMPFP